MKTFMVGALAMLFVPQSQQVDFDAHRHLAEYDPGRQDELFEQGSKVNIVKSKFVIQPSMKLISPMQRYYSRVRPKDADGNAMDLDEVKYPYYDSSDLNPLLEPCGGAKPGRVHFDAEAGSKAYIQWRTLHPDEQGNCTIRLGDGLTDSETEFEVLPPTDGSGKKTKGKFPCGRTASQAEGKEIRFPANLTCDSCTLQVVFETKIAGKLHMCSDVELLNGKIEDCSGQCMNGGVCLNGGCECRKGFSGNFCQIIEYVPDKTNYTLYLKYFLFFIIMVLTIIAFLFGGYLLFKNADKIRENLANLMPQRPEPVIIPKDEDDISGRAPVSGPSRYGQNQDLAD